MARAGLKPGVLAGYLQWDFLELTIADLRECAVLSDIFPPGYPRKLGQASTGVQNDRSPALSAAVQAQFDLSCLKQFSALRETARVFPIC
jgi:hypothetical protein